MKIKLNTEILISIVKEFWLPSLAALAWALYSLQSRGDRAFDPKGFISAFAPAFFLTSWLIGQYFRIKKQRKVDAGLTSIEKSLSDFITQTKSDIDEVMGNISGGDSFPYLVPLGLGGAPGTIPLIAVNGGRYPLHDVAAMVCDLRKFEDIKVNMNFDNMGHAYTHYEIGQMIPSHTKGVAGSLPINTDGVNAFNIFLSARNGSFVQQLRIKMTGESWKMANRVLKQDVEIFCQIDQGYLDGDEIIDWES